MKLKEVFIIREGTDENGRVQFYLTKQYANDALKYVEKLDSERDDPWSEFGKHGEFSEPMDFLEITSSIRRELSRAKYLLQDTNSVMISLYPSYAKMLVLLLAESDDPKIQKIAQAIVKQINT
jgi:hypothetical protein